MATNFGRQPWGLGQRILFLHDGRTNDLVRAIEPTPVVESELSSSEANGVVNGYNRLLKSDQQDLLNFLRSP